MATGDELGSASLVFSPPESVPDGRNTMSPVRPNMPSRPRISVSGMVAWSRMCSISERGRVEQVVLLGVVAVVDLVAVAHLAEVGLGHPGQDAQQRCLARAVEAHDQQPLAAGDRRR